VSTSRTRNHAGPLCCSSPFEPHSPCAARRRKPDKGKKERAFFLEGPSAAGTASIFGLSAIRSLDIYCTDTMRDITFFHAFCYVCRVCVGGRTQRTHYTTARVRRGLWPSRPICSGCRVSEAHSSRSLSSIILYILPHERGGRTHYIPYIWLWPASVAGSGVGGTYSTVLYTPTTARRGPDGA